MPPASHPPAQFRVERETVLAPLIRNVEATLVELWRGDDWLPMIVPDEQPVLDPAERCWTTCMESKVVGLVMDDWRKRKNPNRLQTTVGNAFAGMLAWGPWRGAVQPGSLPFSTTLRTPRMERMLWEILPELRRQRPDRPFAVRHVFPDLPETQLPEDAVLIPARVIYIHDFAAGEPEKDTFRRDRNSLRRSTLKFLEDAEFDEGRTGEALGLYRQLYRERYSRRHPDYTLEMIAWARKRGWLDLEGLSDPETGRLLAFQAYHQLGRVQSVPALGYDLSLPRKLGLYRLLSSSGADRALRRRLLDNASSGAGDFKRKRGFTPVLEYFVAMPSLEGPHRRRYRIILSLVDRIMRRVTLEDMVRAGA